ncbi:hypothetical protein ACGF3G_24010 [Streptomyces sp. NPDC048179]|uniref:hypothetical protein n=1 Tax=Streptomyces sp. NPDC048179 TaxID=3365506 RepID=UPI00371FAE10
MSNALHPPRAHGRPGANWCLLGPGTALRVTPYDIPAAVARVVAECAYPGIEEWANYFLWSRASDGEALGVFRAR